MFVFYCFDSEKLTRVVVNLTNNRGRRGGWGRKMTRSYTCSLARRWTAWNTYTLKVALALVPMTLSLIKMLDHASTTPFARACSSCYVTLPPARSEFLEAALTARGCGSSLDSILLPVITQLLARFHFAGKIYMVDLLMGKMKYSPTWNCYLNI